MTSYSSTLAHAFVVVSLAVVATVLGGVAQPAAAHCGEHTDALSWDAGGRSAGEATPIVSPRNVSFPDETGNTESVRWFKIYVPEPGAAIVPAGWCVDAGLIGRVRLDIYEGRDDGTTSVGTWKVTSDDRRSNLPVLAPGWYDLKLTAFYTDGRNAQIETVTPDRSEYAVRDVTVHPAEPTAGKEATVVARIDRANELGPYQNVSEWLGEVPDEVTVKLRVDGETVASTAATVRAGQSAAVDFTHEFAAAGPSRRNVTVVVEPRWASRPLTATTAVGVTGTNAATATQTPTAITPADGDADAERVNIDTGRVNLLFTADRSRTAAGKSVGLSFSASNLIGDARRLTVQLVVELPAGLTVTGADGVDEGDGQYSQTVTVAPGEVTEVGLRVAADSPGNYTLTGHATYYFGSEKANATTRRVRLPLTVIESTADDGAEGGFPGNGSSGSTATNLGVAVTLIGGTILLWWRETT